LAFSLSTHDILSSVGGAHQEMEEEKGQEISVA